MYVRLLRPDWTNGRKGSTPRHWKTPQQCHSGNSKEITTNNKNKGNQKTSKGTTARDAKHPTAPVLLGLCSFKSVFKVNNASATAAEDNNNLLVGKGEGDGPQTNGKARKKKFQFSVKEKK